MLVADEEDASVTVEPSKKAFEIEYIGMEESVIGSSNRVRFGF